MPDYPKSVAPCYYTPRLKVPYFREPSVALLSAMSTDLSNVFGFTAQFDEELGFDDYLKDDHSQLSDADKLIKFAGQLCYMSMGPNRTKNIDAAKYMENIKNSGHGSVLEHTNFSFLCWGISRSLTHELVRHRAGAVYSQVSQRYVNGKSLRFVERPEFLSDPVLHSSFESRIEFFKEEYENTAQRLYEKQAAGDPTLSGERKTDLRKKVNQAARACLPNETEAPVVVSLNGRALRHVLEMRASVHAEVEIRRMAFKMWECAKEVAPLLLDDYTPVALPDGTFALDTKYRKV